MAFKPNNLSALTYANGFTVWHYRTEDASTTVDAVGYFNAAADVLRVGDFIFANCSIAGTPSSGVMIVRTNTNGVVDVSDMSVLGPNNTR